ncbi:MAG: T9SS type A sorting domain-containing protein [Bacteroidota bacterium]
MRFLKYDCDFSFSLRLFFGNGRLIKEQKFQENEARISLKDLPAGFYIYEITNRKGFYETGKVILR